VPLCRKGDEMAKGEQVEETVEEGPDPMTLPGAHVTVDGKYVGTYPTEDDANEFLRCHVEGDRKTKVTVVE
jgi:hypothetical protein